MNSIGYYDLFFDICSCFSRSAGLGRRQKKVTITEAMAIFEPESFLNIGKI
jgi:hypothetical protein